MYTSDKDRDNTSLGKFSSHETANKTCGESTTLSSKNTVNIKGKVCSRMYFMEDSALMVCLKYFSLVPNLQTYEF